MAIARPPQSKPKPQPSMLPVLFATPAFVVFRKEIGCGLVHPMRLLFAAVLMVAVPHLINFFYQQPLNTGVLVVFAVIVFVLGLRHRQKHRREIAAGESQVHSLETGYSILASALPAMPVWLAVCVDPAACIAAGYVATYICPPFGVFVMLCGGALGLVEWRAYRDERRRFLETHDNFRDGERQGRMADHLAPKPASWIRPESEGTPTGVDDDIEWHLSRRRG